MIAFTNELTIGLSIFAAIFGVVTFVSLITKHMEIGVFCALITGALMFSSQFQGQMGNQEASFTAREAALSNMKGTELESLFLDRLRNQHDKITRTEVAQWDFQAFKEKRQQKLMVREQEAFMRLESRLSGL